MYPFHFKIKSTDPEELKRFGFSTLPAAMSANSLAMTMRESEYRSSSVTTSESAIPKPEDANINPELVVADLKRQLPKIVFVDGQGREHRFRDWLLGSGVNVETPSEIPSNLIYKEFNKFLDSMKPPISESARLMLLTRFHQRALMAIGGSDFVNMARDTSELHLMPRFTYIRITIQKDGGLKLENTMDIVGAVSVKEGADFKVGVTNGYQPEVEAAAPLATIKATVTIPAKPVNNLVSLHDIQVEQHIHHPGIAENLETPKGYVRAPLLGEVEKAAKTTLEAYQTAKGISVSSHLKKLSLKSALKKAGQNDPLTEKKVEILQNLEKKILEIGNSPVPQTQGEYLVKVQKAISEARRANVEAELQEKHKGKDISKEMAALTDAKIYEKSSKTALGRFLDQFESQVQSIRSERVPMGSEALPLNVSMEIQEQRSRASAVAPVPRPVGGSGWE